MKTRNGFVSNSSSSSFIVHDSISNVSKAMLNLVISDWEQDRVESAEDKKVHAKWRRNLTNAFKKKEIIDGVIGITMPSTNYETYIIEKGNNCYVKTANNHNWESVIDPCYNVVEEIDRTVDDYYFLNVRNNLIHSVEKYDKLKEDSKAKGKKCPVCNKDHEIYSFYVVDRKGNKICNGCYEGTVEEVSKEDKEFIKLQIKLKKSFPNPISQIEL